jgi:hypothetical protein
VAGTGNNQAQIPEVAADSTWADVAGFGKNVWLPAAWTLILFHHKMATHITNHMISGVIESL